ncbi:polysaccharide pyruvyl transferase family protein [Candidatus Odyssella acanthamoebae]|uniref:Polysaccharide pyruvyl transferase domain-containing protein n=1 Tax=Candidatus Odyssella acanthamoebae TaxID=91604 RepID=A0A077B1Y6_9PROT|nr:polysaccharide pyruvyl transferase family protein [Candidatus Paracaedibacter acanthamoebae]AIK96940.1 hypothetical protein ID47_09700 [Candidatus Paracaedibacter acanthamoebae]
MKVAVFGWYGHDNAGDERIKYSLEYFLKTLGGIDAVNFYDLHKHAIQGKTSKFDHYDLIIIGGGGLILSQHNYHDFIMGIGTKIITAGVSVETALIGNPKKFAEALLEKSSAFLVRDQASKEKLTPLDRDNKVVVSSDLTFLTPFEIVPYNLSNTIAVNFLAKSKINLAAIPRFLLKTIEIANRLGIKNMPPIYSFKQIVRVLKNKYSIIPIPLYTVKQPPDIPYYQMNDVAILHTYFNQVASNFDDSLMDECNLFLSMRLHGLIFAIQKGLLPLTFSIYPKQINIMKEVGLDSGIIDIRSIKETPRFIENSLNNIETNREKVIFYREKASIQITNDVLRVIN